MNKYKELLITSNFGLRELNGIKEFHPGIDFRPNDNNEVWSGYSGVINRIDYGNLEGQYIQVLTKINQLVCYINIFHLQESLSFLKKGMLVRPDDNIAIAGNTGRSYGKHIHYEIFTYDIENKFAKTIQCNINTYLSKEFKVRMYINPIQLFDYCIGKGIYV